MVTSWVHEYITRIDKIGRWHHPTLSPSSVGKSHHNGKGQAEVTEITPTYNLDIKSSINLGAYATFKDLNNTGEGPYHISV